MRLICGLWHLDDRPAASETIDAMVSALVSPGLTPRVRIYRNGPIGLGVVDYAPRADHTVTLPRGNDGAVLAADVRLDDADDLSRTVCGEAADQDAALLGAIERWGADAPVHVLGDYAFAAWMPHTQQFLCGRDALGVRPFVYTHRPGGLFAFASTPRALHVGLVERKIDRTAFARRFARAGRVDETIFTDICRLPAGHTLCVSVRGLTTRRYWQLSLADAGAQKIHAADAAVEMRRVVESAVRSRTPSAGSVAVHLSGGLDSTAIAILAVRRLRAEQRRLLAYSFLARQPERASIADEGPFVDAVCAAETGFDWTPVYAPAFERFLAARMDVDRPLSVESDDPENAVCRHAAAHGADIVLSGWGGDEGPTFFGHGVLAEEFLRGHWRYVAAEIGALARANAQSRMQVCRAEILSAFAPDLIRHLDRFRARPPRLTERLRRALRDDLVATAGDLDAGRPFMGPDGRRNRLRLLASPHLTERMENWAAIGSRYGQAFAFPLLDRRVVEFSASLPSALFLRDGFSRRVFRDAMAGVLPELIRWRRDKLIPLPDQPLAVVTHRDSIVRWLTDAAADPRVHAVFDIDRVQASIAALPSAEEMAAPSDARGRRAGVAAMYSIIPAIAFIKQHG